MEKFSYACKFGIFQTFKNKIPINIYCQNLRQNCQPENVFTPNFCYAKFFTRKLFYDKIVLREPVFTPKYFYTKFVLRQNVFNQKCFYAKMFFTLKCFYANIWQTKMCFAKSFQAKHALRQNLFQPNFWRQYV